MTKEAVKIMENGLLKRPYSTMVETGIGRIAAQNVFAANRYTISNAGGLSDEDMEAVIDAAEKNKKLDDMKAAIENYLAAHYI